MNALTCYWAAYIPSVYFLCVMLNYMCVGGIFAIFPVAVTNVFGLEVGPQIYVWLLLGSFVSSLINLFETTVLEKAIGFASLFYFGAVMQVLALIVIFFYEEKLDVERLRKHDALRSQDPDVYSKVEDTE